MEAIELVSVAVLAEASKLVDLAAPAEAKELVGLAAPKVILIHVESCCVVLVKLYAGGSEIGLYLASIFSLCQEL